VGGGGWSLLPAYVSFLVPLCRVVERDAASKDSNREFFVALLVSDDLIAPENPTASVA